MKRNGAENNIFDSKRHLQTGGDDIRPRVRFESVAQVYEKRDGVGRSVGVKGRKEFELNGLLEKR